MSDSLSPYYPPRARWSRHLFRVGYICRRLLHLEDVSIPLPTAPGRFLAGLLLPGVAFLDFQWKIVPAFVMSMWLLALLTFFAFLGYFVGNAAFGALISLHVSSILYLLHRTFPGLSIRNRLFLSLSVLLVVSQLMYATSLGYMQKHWFMPLRRGGKVFIVQPVRPAMLRRGDLVACYTVGSSGGAVRIHDGYFLDRVLAVPNDQVTFRPGEFVVNDELAAALPLMPRSGFMVLPKNKWLVWPALTTINHYRVSDEEIAASVLQLAIVSGRQIVGKPFRYWFWRRQIL